MADELLDGANEVEAWQSALNAVNLAMSKAGTIACTESLLTLNTLLRTKFYQIDLGSAHSTCRIRHSFRIPDACNKFQSPATLPHPVSSQYIPLPWSVI